jgi:sugar O-acyltransferase (sialic acid O-acetyltransferase NeuD family)
MKNNPVIIFGASGLGRAALDIFNSNKVVTYCFLDENAALQGKEINDIAVLGKPDDESILKYLGKKCEAFIASDDNKYKKNLVEMLTSERKIMPVNAIHAKAIVSELAFLGYGNMIHAGAIISANAKIPNHCIISSGVVIDFDAELEDYVQIGSGTILNSGVKVGKNAFIGSGVTIVSGVSIGKNARIGAGSVVVSDVQDGETVFGNPAKVVDKVK